MEEIPKIGKKVILVAQIFEHLLKLNAKALNIMISLSDFFDRLYVE